MTIAEQHREFDIRANKIDSNHYQHLLPNQKDSFLHEAAVFICNHYGELLEFNNSQFNKDLFSTLLVKYPDQIGLTPAKNTEGQYEIDLSKLKYKYFHLDRAYIQCENQVIPISMIKHDEQNIFNDSYKKPSYKWKRLYGIIGKKSSAQGNSLYIYSDVDLTNKKIRIEYVKFPKKVFFGYYDSIEFLDCKKRENIRNWVIEDCNQYYKSTDQPVNSELPDTYHSLQVDIAVWLATGKTENQFINQFINNKIISLPK